MKIKLENVKKALPLWKFYCGEDWYEPVKFCNSCKTDHPVGEFWNSACRNCMASNDARYTSDRREGFQSWAKSIERRRIGLEKARATSKKSNAKLREEHPEFNWKRFADALENLKLKSL